MAVTYAAIKQAPEVAEENEERTIWIMKQPLSGSLAVKEARKVVLVRRPFSEDADPRD